MEPAITFDGGALDCGGGLLLLIRNHIDQIESGEIMELFSSEGSVLEELPAWCRMTNNELLATKFANNRWCFLIKKAERSKKIIVTSEIVSSGININNPEGITSSTLRDLTIPQLAVMGIGSWPRPKWLLDVLHQKLIGRVSSEEFNLCADDGVRLVVNSQIKAGCDVISDGEQRRDNYASFVGGILKNCQLIPLIDLLGMIDEPEKLAVELKNLEIPIEDLRHPVATGKIVREVGLTDTETKFLKKGTSKPLKVAIPGPYLLTRTIWLECLNDKFYQTREMLAMDLIIALRAEIKSMIDSGVTIIQIDEPVLTEIVFAPPKTRRSFMCGALSEKLPIKEELAFACNLINQVVSGFPENRLALHICRGNWTSNEGVALVGSYDPLIETLAKIQVGTLFLEACTNRSGLIDILKELPKTFKLGIGVVNQKIAEVESHKMLIDKISTLIKNFGAERLYLTPDCGFASFADSPICSASVAEAKLAAIVIARAEILGCKI